MMLANSPVIAQLPAVDLDRAVKFYEEKLGLKAVMDFPGGKVFGAGEGTAIAVYTRGATKADHTVAAFRVADLEAEVKALTAKGVQFEQYNMPEYGLTTNSLGIAENDGGKLAWFKDSEGNILGLTQI